MHQIERRLAALESQVGAANASLKVVFVEEERQATCSTSKPEFLLCAHREAVLQSPAPDEMTKLMFSAF